MGCVLHSRARRTAACALPRITLLLAGVGTLLTLAQPAMAGVTVTSQLATLTAPLTAPPWHATSTGIVWVPLMYPSETRGDALTNYMCTRAETTGCASLTTATNAAWGNGPLGGFGFSDPFNNGTYVPFSQPALFQFNGLNDCQTFATCLSTETLTVAAGQSIDVYFASDVSWSSSDVTSLLELVVQEPADISNTLNIKPIALFASRSAGLTAQQAIDYAVFNGTQKVAINALFRLTLTGPSTFKWGFRSRSTSMASADNWHMTRTFFGCMGPARTTVLSKDVDFTATSVVLQSLVTTSLPDGSTVSAAGVVWTFSCDSGRPSPATTTGLSVTLTAGGPGSAIQIGTQAYTCTASFVATTSRGCPVAHDMTLNIAAAPVLSPVVSGLPTTSVKAYPSVVNLAANTTTVMVGAATFVWTLTCNGNITRTFSTQTVAVTVGAGQMIDPGSPYGNKACNVSVQISTPVQGSALSPSYALTLLAPPVATFTGAPYTVTTGDPNAVQLSASASSCASPPCSTQFAVVCPNGRNVNKTSSTIASPVSITAGRGQEIDPFAVPLITSATLCSVTLIVTDSQGLTDTKSSTLTVQAPVLVPANALSGLPVIGGNLGGPFPRNVSLALDTSGYASPPNISWAVTCPPGSFPPVANQSGTSFNFGVGSGLQVDPFSPTYGSLPCSVAVTVCVPLQGCTTTASNVTVLPTPTATLAGAPFTAKMPYPSVVNLEATDTKCNAPPCTYEWITTLPDGSNVTRTGAKVPLGIGKGEAVDPYKAPFTSSDANLTVTLKVTDSSVPPQVLTAATKLLVPSPLSGPNAFSGLPPTGSAVGGPYPLPVNLAVNTSGIPQGATYSWTLKCPPGAAVPTATSSSANFSFVVGSGKAVDPFAPYGNKECELAVTVTAPGNQTMSASSNVTYLAPPGPSSIAGGPFQIGPDYPAQTTLDAGNASCASPPCTYQWAIDCADGRSAKLNGNKVPVLIADSPSATINPFKPTRVEEVTECNVTLTVTDSSKPPQTTKTSTTLTLYPSGPTVTLINAPYAAVAGETVGMAGTAKCTDAPCTYAWTIDCPAQGALLAQSKVLQGLVVNASTGANLDANGTNLINTNGLTAALVCSVRLRAADSKNVTASARTTLTVYPFSASNITSCGGTPIAIKGINNGEVIRMRPASVAVIKAQSNSANCAAKRALRRGKKQKIQASVTIPAFADATGRMVFPTITGIMVNQAENACVCRKTRTNNCTCIPDGIIANAGQTALLMPGVSPSPNTAAGRVSGRQYLLRFTGLVRETGAKCEGFAPVCIFKAKRVKKGVTPPTCQPFGSSATVRDATLCNNVTTTAFAALDAADADGAEVEMLLPETEDLGV